MTKILNAKPTIKGSDSHAASLSGSGSVASSNPSATTLSGSTTFNSTVNNPFVSIPDTNTVMSTAVVVPSTDSVVVISVAFQAGNGSGSVKVRNTTTGTDIISSFVIASGGPGGIAYTQVQGIDTTPTLGVSNTYAVIATSSTSIFKGGIQVRVVTLSDSHAGVLSGSNTQETKSPYPIA